MLKFVMQWRERYSVMPFESVNMFQEFYSTRDLSMIRWAQIIQVNDSSKDDLTVLNQKTFAYRTQPGRHPDTTRMWKVQAVMIMPINKFKKNPNTFPTVTYKYKP